MSRLRREGTLSPSSTKRGWLISRNSCSSTPSHTKAEVWEYMPGAFAVRLMA